MTRRRRARAAWFLVLFLVLMLVLFGWLRSRLWPVVRSLAETQVKNTTSDLINDAIQEQILNGNIEYDRIVYFEKDLNGRITALKTNMAEVNRLKTDILNLVNDQILAQATEHLGISLGSIFLPEFFSGRGPDIPIRVLTIRNSDANFDAAFSEAGINQTLHQLRMEVQVDVTVLVLGQTETFPVTSQVVVAETIIVGDVPETYFQTGGNDGTQRENSASD